MKDPAFLFYTKDFQSGTQDMSCEEVGAYLRLLLYQHQHGRIPYDKERLMRITGIFTIEKFENVWNIIRPKFNEIDNHLVNQRLNQIVNERSTGMPKKIASATLAGLISSSKMSKEESFIVKQNFKIDFFIYENGELISDEILIKSNVRHWFNNEILKLNKQEGNKETVNHLVNNLANENGDANEDVIEIKNVIEKRVINENSKIDCEKIVSIFNSVCNRLPEVQKLTLQRKTTIKSRVSEYGLSGVGDVFQKVSESSFLNGENDRGWTADFDWILKPANFIKILEGKYKNTDNGKQKSITGQSKVQYSENFQRKIAEGLQS